jgi:4-alpha-glucanotransferase
MNIPGHSGGNWQWRFLPSALSKNVQRRLAEMSYLYGRTT